jgi:hypothetical protein
MRIEYDEWIRLLRRMLDNQVVTLVRADSLPQWKGRPVTAGLNGVPKSLGSMRLIVDRRWQNSLECNLLTALARRGTPQSELSAVSRLIRLPHGGMRAELMLEPGDVLCISVDGL